MGRDVPAEAPVARCTSFMNDDGRLVCSFVAQDNAPDVPRGPYLRTCGGCGGLARGTALGEQREEDRAVRRKDVVRGAVLLARTRRSLLRTPERCRKELQERGAALELCCLWCL